MLSVGAGLMMRSLWRLNAVDPGFKPEHLLALDIAPGGPKYAKEYAVLNFARQVEQRVASLPGVQEPQRFTGFLSETCWMRTLR